MAAEAALEKMHRTRSCRHPNAESIDDRQDRASATGGNQESDLLGKFAGQF